MKNIVLCSDGTGNASVKGRGTNVWKLFEALDLEGHRADPTLPRQIAFYDDGVGTERFFFLKLVSGAFGFGLARNVRELYAALCRVYQPGDRIYLFGFSRGAFTVRTLAGMIAECGIIAREHITSESALRCLVRRAYKAFRSNFKTWQREQLARLMPHTNGRRSRRFRETYGVQDDKLVPQGVVPIAFVGVWDTVDAVGLPFDHLTDLLNAALYPFRFPDFKLGQQVERACQALAIDDERHTFHPVMWDESGERDGRIEQVWFVGAHSNVGGGYPKQGLSLVSLDWMMSRAEASGLRFEADVRREYRARRNVHDKLYDSRAGLGVFYRYKPRDIARICASNGITRPKVHASVLDRVALATEGYAPVNLPGAFDVVERESANLLDARIDALARTTTTTLLERLRPLVLVRRWSHYALTGSLVALMLGQWPWNAGAEATGHVAAAASSAGLSGWLRTLAAETWRRMDLFEHWERALGVLLALAIVSAASAAARGAMGRTCSASWTARLRG